MNWVNALDPYAYVLWPGPQDRNDVPEIALSKQNRAILEQERSIAERFDDLANRDAHPQRHHRGKGEVDDPDIGN